jgi:antitoxin component YwqK of YwqJK toxin-antitoxin module
MVVEPQVIRRWAGALALAFAGACAAQPYSAEGHCREGLPHGNYELRDAGGTLRAIGAFNRGKRTGSFIFWSSEGVRIAHLPFDDDALSGTLATWYTGKSANEPQRKVEAAYSHGKLNGSKRSWYPNGRARAVYRYDKGELREASATDPDGKPLGAAEARSLAQRDAAADSAFIASLLAIVAANPPRCEASGDRA